MHTIIHVRSECVAIYAVKCWQHKNILKIDSLRLVQEQSIFIVGKYLKNNELIMRNCFFIANTP